MSPASGPVGLIANPSATVVADPEETGEGVDHGVAGGVDHKHRALSAGHLAGDEDVAGVGAGGADRDVARPAARR